MKMCLRVAVIAGLALSCFASLRGQAIADRQVPPELKIYQDAKSFVDFSPQELIGRYPPLRRTLKLAEDQSELAPLLEKVGKNVESFLKYFPNTASSEEVRQELQAPARITGRSAEPGFARRTSNKYQYVIVTDPHNSTNLEEYRTNSKGAVIELSGLSQGFFLTSRFATVPLLLHPVHQPGSRFRYLGTTSEPKAQLIAFAQIPGMTKLYHQYWIIPAPKVSVYFQGLVWVDPASYQIVRMYTELLVPRKEIGLESEASEIDFEQVSFSGVSQVFWLPHEVNVTIRQGSWVYRNRHRYSDYKLFTVESYDKVKLPAPPL